MRGLSLFLISLLVFTYLGWGKSGVADEQMQALCSKDGGVKIYETVTIPKRQFDKWGMPRGKHWDRSHYPSTLDPEYEYTNSSEFLQRGDTLRGGVEMSRYVEQIRRVSDGKLLAESISYGRSGGDHFINRILGGHPSAKHCPIPIKGLISTVFIQGE